MGVPAVPFPFLLVGIVAEWKIESKENEGTKITIWFSLEDEV